MGGLCSSPENASFGDENNFKSKYRLGKKLGEGAYAVVKEGTSRKTDEKYAIKIVTKSKLNEEDEVALQDEIRILKAMRHENIVRLYDCYDEYDYYYLVMECVVGGELFDRIVDKTSYNEKEARDVCIILFKTLAYCHSKNVAHRDLKPENLLLASYDDDTNIKIADFGFAKELKPGMKGLMTQCGTPAYVAPEILSGNPYGLLCDTWSMGVIVYILLGGYPPFQEKNQRDLFRKIRRGDFKFHDKFWRHISNDAEDFISKLLTVDPQARLSAADALNHDWVHADIGLLSVNNLGANLEEFKKFNANRKFKSAVKAVMMANKLNSLGVNFHQDL